MSDLEIFYSRPDGASASERAAYLDEACGDDAALRKRVEALFALENQHDDYLEDPLIREPVEKLAEGVGSVIGNYKLLQEIGRGGFGTVYMADQLAPVKRRVALKIIKLGMDTKQVVARFEVERQALAMMDHPNIAKVHDAGATETGRPFFVMELVRGLAITKFCEERKLDTASRLALFIDVCGAVQHAHQKGIIHRDLKPSNVLVTLHDDKAVPKIIDFGVAKATQQELTDKTLFTQFEQFIGTPAYMSPEQAQMSGLDIDTRSDIYALGVLLYELLTGTTPFDAQALAQAGQDEIRRMIREEEPPKPSTRLTALQKRKASHPEIPMPSTAIDRDLDWIIMKALEKDRVRRYDTANGLSLDIQRHLNNEPVTAAAPSTIYQLSKYARRHRSVIGTILAIAAALIVGIIVSVWFAYEATEAKEAVELAKKDVETQLDETKAARAEAVKARKAADENALSIALRLTDEADSRGIAQLAKFVRDDPSNGIAAERMMATLRHREFPMPLWEPISGLTSARFSQDGTKIVATNAYDRSVKVLNALTGQIIGKPMQSELPGYMSDAQFGPAGRQILAHTTTDTSRPSFVQVWDWRTGKPLTGPMKHERYSQAHTFSPDGLRIFTGDDGGQCNLWDATTGVRLHQFQMSSSVRAADWSKDGKLVAVAGGSSVVVWDASTGSRTFHRLYHEKGVACVRFSGDDRRLVTATNGGIAKIWDLESAKPIGDSMVHGDKIRCLDVSPDDSLVLTASLDGTARIWNAKTGKPLASPLKLKGEPIVASFDPTGQRILVGGRGSIQIWDIHTGEQISHRTIQTYLSWPNRAEFSPDGTAILLTGGEISVWPLSPKLPKHRVFRHDDGPWAQRKGSVRVAKFSPDGLLLATVGMDEWVRLWDVETGSLIRKMDHRWGPRWVSFSKDGQRLLSASTRDGARIWNVETGERICTILDSENTNHAEFSPDPEGKWVALGTRTARHALIVDSLTGELVGPPLQHQDFVIRVAFSPRGDRLATACYGGVVAVWDVLNGRRLATMSGHAGLPEQVTFNATGTRILTASLDHTARVWNAATGEEILALHHLGAVSRAVFSPDERHILTASADGSARMWDSTTGQPVGAPMRHAQAVTHANFSRDGSRVITVSWDKTARVWDAATGLPLSDALEHHMPASYADFSPDGRSVVTTGLDRTARIWDVPPAPDQPVPTWVPDWAEAVIGMRIGSDNALETLPWSERLRRLKVLYTLQPDEDPFYARTAQWIASSEQSGHQTVTPFCDYTNSDYVRDAIRALTRDSFADAAVATLTNSAEMGRAANQLWEYRNPNSDTQQRVLLRELYEFLVRTLGKNDAATLDATRTLANQHHDDQNHQEALALRQAVLDGARKDPLTDPEDVLLAMTALSHSLVGLDRQEEALTVRHQAVEFAETKLGRFRSETLTAIARVSNTLHHLGRYEEALEIRKDLVIRTHGAADRSKYNRTSIRRSAFARMRGLAETYKAMGRTADEVATRRDLFEQSKEAYGAKDELVLESMPPLAVAMTRLGGMERETIELLRECVAIGKEANIATWRTRASMKQLWQTHQSMGQWEEARQVEIDRWEYDVSELEPGDLELASSMAKVRALKALATTATWEAGAKESHGSGDVPTTQLEATKIVLAQALVEASESALRDTHGVRSADLLAELGLTPPHKTLISKGATWSYSDASLPLPESNWHLMDYDDAPWPQGAAELGFNGGDEPKEATEMMSAALGESERTRFFFRHRFRIEDLQASIVDRGLILRLNRDDGALIYLNGEEIIRSNIDQDGKAGGQNEKSVNGPDETKFFDYVLSPNLLREGENIVAVEVRQNKPTSSDLSFDLGLVLAKSPGSLLETVPVDTLNEAIQAVAPFGTGDADLHLSLGQTLTNTPTSLAEWKSLAQVQRALWRHQEAIEAIDQALNGTPDSQQHKELLTLKAELLSFLGQ